MNEQENLNAAEQTANLASIGMQSNYLGYIPYDTCPRCGYCKHCGRSNNHPYPLYEPYKITWGNTSNLATAQTNQTIFNK